MVDGGDRLLLLYDGVCALCNGLVRFVVARDRGDRFRFASLQSDLAHTLLRRHGKDPDDLATLYVVLGAGEAGERLLERSTAVLRALEELGPAWRALSHLTIVPRPLRDAVYALVARTRYRVFGKHESCPLPLPSARGKFLDP